MPGWLFASFHGYDRKWLRGDLVAGLTVWAVLVPEALAYASIAGVSPVVGLYAAPGALLLYAAFGSSRHLIVGPSSATAALSAATVSSVATAGSGRFVELTAALAISAGLAALIAGLLRLGFLASFISEPVLKGFIVGLALTIIVGQLPALFGVAKGSGDFFQKLWDVITNLGDTQLRRGAGAAKTYAAKHHYDIDVNHELVGLGTANLASGLSSGMVVNGSLSKTAVNGSAGATSQVSGLVVAAMTIVTLLLLTGLFEKLPEATLAAVVIVAVLELVDFRALVRLYGVCTRRLGRAYGVAARPDFIAAVAALLGVTVFDTLPGLFIGIAVSFVLLLYRASRPRVAELARAPDATHYAALDQIDDGERVHGVVILRVEAGLFFANADWVRGHVRSAAGRPGTHAVVLDASNIAFIDVTAVEMLDQLADTLQSEGVALRVARDTGGVRDVLRRAGTEPRLQRVYGSVRAAVEASRTDPDAPPLQEPAPS